MYSSRVINPFSIRSFASASVCARLETRSSSNLTGFLSGFCHCFSYVDFLMDFPLPRRFRFGRLGSTRTCVAFFAMNWSVRDRAEVWTIERVSVQSSFDHLVRPEQHRLRNRESDLLRGFQIDYQFELLGLLDWQVGWFACLFSVVFSDSVHHGQP